MDGVHKRRHDRKETENVRCCKQTMLEDSDEKRRHYIMWEKSGKEEEVSKLAILVLLASHSLASTSGSGVRISTGSSSDIWQTPAKRLPCRPLLLDFTLVTEFPSTIISHGKANK
jgi:hypothetical protein